MEKKLAIRRMIGTGMQADKIILAATTAPGDSDYQRRLRLWGADCAAHAAHLMRASRQQKEGHAAINGARLYARAFYNDAMLMVFDCPPGSQLYEATKKDSFSPASEARLAAALCAQKNVWTGALGASTHARRAISHQKDEAGAQLQASVDELGWQVGRLLLWLCEPEPRDWPVG